MYVSVKVMRACMSSLLLNASNIYYYMQLYRFITCIIYTSIVSVCMSLDVHIIHECVCFSDTINQRGYYEQHNGQWLTV